MARFGRSGSAVTHGGPSSSTDNVGFWLRLAAGLIDVAIVVVLAIPFFAFYLGAFISLLSNPSVRTAEILTGMGLALFFVWYIVLLAYLVAVFVFVCIRGQSPGKMALGIKIVRQDGDALGPSVALLRWVSFWSIGGPLGFVFLAWDRDKLAVHDHIAGTMVVRAR